MYRGKREHVVIEKGSELYPEELTQIKNPPDRLYCIGNLKLLKKRKAAVIGSRKVSTYGRWVAESLGRVLGENDVAVVSGLAKGADTFGHIGALSVGGNTIAVLGTAIDRVYPAENRALQAEIERKGLVISEYPPGYPTQKWNFPFRNRIIAALSENVYLAEAGLGSGSLITVELANEYNKNVYVVPGNINSQYNIGSNKLFNDGASAIVNIEDAVTYMSIKPKSKELLYSNLGSDEIKIMKVLENGAEMTIDEIAKATHIPPGQVNALVTILEIKGCLYNSMGKVFVAL